MGESKMGSLRIDPEQRPFFFCGFFPMLGGFIRRLYSVVADLTPAGQERVV